MRTSNVKRRIEAPAPNNEEGTARNKKGRGASRDRAGEAAGRSTNNFSDEDNAGGGVNTIADRG